MVVAVGGQSSIMRGDAVTSLSDSTFTVGAGSNTALLVPIAMSGNASGVAVTWNGVALTQLAAITSTDTGESTYLFGMLNPATGNHTLAFTWVASSQDIGATALLLTGVEQSSVAAAFTHATTNQGATSPATVTVTSAAGDMAVAVFCANFCFLTEDNTSVFNYHSASGTAGASNRAAGAASVVLSATESANQTWCGCGINAHAAAGGSTPTGGGTPTDAGTTFKRTHFYQSFTQPVVFTVAATPYAGWDDTLEWPRLNPPRSTAYSAPFIAQALGIFLDRDNPEDWTNWPDFAPGRPRIPLHQSWSFVPPPAQVFFPYAPWDDFARTAKRIAHQPDWSYGTFVTPAFIPTWTQWDQWPDFATRKKPVVDFTPWTFLEPAPQVWFPYQPWDDFTRRKPQPLDTQPLAWPPTPVATPFPAMGWNNWPDFATRQKPTASFTPWTFIPTPAQVFFPYAPWDDFTRRKPQYPDTQPLAWTGQNIAAPAPMMAWLRWPDFAPKKPTASDLWPLAFVPIPPTATVIGDWPDFVRRKPQPLDTQPLSWTSQTITAQQVWFPYDPWPGLIAKKPVPLNYIPATPFIQTPAQVFFPYGPWDDFTRRKPQYPDTQPQAWTGQTIAAQQVWFPHDTWPDRVPGARRVAEFQSFDFVAIPPITTEVRDWPDFAWRKSQPLDTQPLIWSGFTPAATVFFVPTNWPDFAPKARPLVDVRPWSFIQSPAQVFFPYGLWDDFARRKPSPLIYPPSVLVPIHVPPLGYLQWPDFATKKRPPLNYIPLTFVQTIRTPWNELSRWPEMVPIRSKAGLHAALQQFSARFPGTITQATITGILNAFEVNSDVASITVFVRQSGPAVRAAVSIQEIGTI